MYRAGDWFVVAENCAHQLRTGFQGFSSMVFEVWHWGFGFWDWNVFVCLGLRLGLGLESGLLITDGGNLCATLVLSSLTTYRYSIKVIMA